jgi:hypothetical protein
MTDPVLEPLLAIARDSSPEVFDTSDPYEGIRAQRGVSPMAVAPALKVAEDHPRAPDFARALAADPVLGAFAHEPGTFIQANIGQGWLLQPTMVAPQLIATAALEILSATDPNASSDELIARTSDALERFRRLAAGEPATATRLIALEGISVPPGKTIETPWGMLREPGPLEKQASSPFTIAASFSTGRPTVILESKIDLKYEVGEPSADPSGGGLREPELQVEAELGTMLLAIAAALAIRRERHPVVVPLWSTVIVVAGAGGSYTGALRTVSPFRPSSIQLDEIEAAALTEWAENLKSRYHPSIEVALRRTLRAIGERLYEDDALIDAVVAWENLFGHGGTTEVVFRVTLALAELLEDDPEKRAQLRKELAKIYRLRSRVLHGDALSPNDDLTGSKERAIEVALSAIAHLFRNEPSLIADRGRGLTLLLR